MKGVTFFEFGEEITCREIFESAGGGDFGRGMDAANLFIRALVGEITKFQSQATITMFKSFGMVSERIQTELRDRYCAAPGRCGSAAETRRRESPPPLRSAPLGHDCSPRRRGRRTRYRWRRRGSLQDARRPAPPLP